MEKLIDENPYKVEFRGVSNRRMGETSGGDLVEVRVDPRITPVTPTTMRRTSDTSVPSRVRQLAKRLRFSIYSGKSEKDPQT